MRKHWAAILGTVLVLPELWRIAKWFLDWVGRVDAVVAHYGQVRSMIENLPPPLSIALLLAGGVLIWWDLKRARTTLAVVGQPSDQQEAPSKFRGLGWPSVKEWFSPIDAIERYGSADLHNAIDQATSRYERAAKALEIVRAERTEQFGGEIQAVVAAAAGNYDNSRFESASKEFHDAQMAVVIARKYLVDDLVKKLRSGDLVARAVPYEEGKLYGEWEYLKQAYWVTLTFDSYDQSMETVSGGGKKYKGVQIGKHEATK